MTADQAIKELLDVSEDIVAAVLLDAEGAVIASTVDTEDARSAAETAAAMLAYGDALRAEARVVRLEARTGEGCVFVVREGRRAVVAATAPDPVEGLVLHDLRTTLRKTAGRTRAKAGAAA